MRYLPALPLLLALVATSAFAQTTTGIEAARAQYTKSETAPETLAQLPRRPCPSCRPRSGYPRGRYPAMWHDDAQGRHAAIGALIGFGLGAAIGAGGNTDQNIRARVATSLIVGSIGAAFGALIGGSFPSYHSCCHRHRRYEEDPEDEESASKAAPPTTQQSSPQVPEITHFALPAEAPPPLPAS